MSTAETIARFRALHERPGAFVIPNPWDIGSARLLADAGFEALATTSAGFAWSIGKPDGGVGRDEMLSHCAEIVAATPLPVNADLENCYAHDPAGVAQRSGWPPATGLAGASIEDSTGDAGQADLRFRSRGGARSRRRRRQPRAADADADHARARKISSTAARTSPTRSSACRRSRRPAPTCSMRRAWRRSTRSAR